MQEAITHKELLARFSYSPETGLFTRLSNGRVMTPNSGRYLQFVVAGRNHYAHRLAWLYTHGTWPVEVIDHINGDTRDNRISNLREATRGQNQANQRISRASASGLKGVRRHGAGRWCAAITENKRQIHLGTFGTPEEAHQAYVQAAKRIFKEFARFS